MKKRTIEAALPVLAVWMILAGCNTTEQSTESIEIQTEMESADAEYTLEEAETASNETENEILPEEAYRYAYYDFLKEYAEAGKNSGNSSEKSGEVKFALAYIDGDEIPELLLVEGDFRAIAVEVYAYADDAVIKLFNFNSDNGSIGMLRNRDIFSVADSIILGEWKVFMIFMMWRMVR